MVGFWLVSLVIRLVSSVAVLFAKLSGRSIVARSGLPETFSDVRAVLALTMIYPRSLSWASTVVRAEFLERSRVVSLLPEALSHFRAVFLETSRVVSWLPAI